MLSVKRTEKATRVRFSLILRGVILREPDANARRQAKEVDEVWRVVSSHGKRACRSSQLVRSGVNVRDRAYLSKYGFVRKCESEIEYEV